MLRRTFIPTLMIFMVMLTLTIMPVAAQEAQPTPAPTAAQPTKPPVPLALSTTYPSQVIGLGETVSLPLKLHTETTAQVVKLEVQGLPTGWTSTFRGGGQVINAVYVDTTEDATADLQIGPPTDVAAGTYKFTVVATGTGTKSELPVELTVQEKLPPKVSLTADLPTLKGTPTTTFRFSVTLKNEGDVDLTINLTSDAPPQFLVTYNLAGQDVTDVPLGARQSKNLSVSAKPIGDVQAGTYQINMTAQSAEIQTNLQLVAEVTGQAEMTITSPDGNLSGTAYAGKETPLKVVIRNSGTASAHGIELSSTSSTGWSITFDPKTVTEVPAGQQVEVTANIRPSDKAVAGDYMITVKANSAEGLSSSTDFRITVRTSTIWGVVGIILIAVAVGVVTLAVTRFGRR